MLIPRFNNMLDKFPKLFEGIFIKVAEVPLGGEGSPKREIVITPNSIALVIYIKDTDEFVFVRQRRPAMKTPINPEGYCTELVAGRIDKDLSLFEIAAEEASEEAKIRINPEEIHYLLDYPLAPSPGQSTEKVYLAYAVVDQSRIEEKDRQCFGNLEEGEETFRSLVKRSECGIESNFYESDSSALAMLLFLQKLEKGER